MAPKAKKAKKAKPNQVNLYLNPRGHGWKRETWDSGLTGPTVIVRACADLPPYQKRSLLMKIARELGLRIADPQTRAEAEKYVAVHFPEVKTMTVLRSSLRE